MGPDEACDPSSPVSRAFQLELEVFQWFWGLGFGGDLEGFIGV